MESIWKQQCTLEKRPSLQKDMQVQVVVIGAGLAGILTAYFLKKKGIEVLVLEANEIASGQTQNTTAKITSQHGLFYQKLIQKVGRDRAKAYALANEQAIYAYEQLIVDEKIECYFERKSAYLYSQDEKQIPKLQKEASVARSLGIDAHYIEGKEITELPFEVAGAVIFKNQAQIHPLEFINHIAANIPIYEKTKVLSVKNHLVVTNKGKVKAKHIVFATHYPFVNIPGFFFLRQHQERSYVLALKKQKELQGMYYSIDTNGLSLRSEGNTLLLGGGSHRTGKHQKSGYVFLREMAKTYYPDATEECKWSAQDCMPHDEIPFIGRYSMLRPYWYVATGFKKWGMTSAMVAAILISNHIAGISQIRKNPFSPQRLLIRAAIVPFMKDIKESTIGLCKGLFSGKAHRCPHMGCRLEWNEDEESWDCPCHGSRFDCHGELLDNPAQIDKK